MANQYSPFFGAVVYKPILRFVPDIEKNDMSDAEYRVKQSKIPIKGV